MGERKVGKGGRGGEVEWRREKEGWWEGGGGGGGGVGEGGRG